jgi:hypothetical protein
MGLCIASLAEHPRALPVLAPHMWCVPRLRNVPKELPLPSDNHALVPCLFGAPMGSRYDVPGPGVPRIAARVICSASAAPVTTGLPHTRRRVGRTGTTGSTRSLADLAVRPQARRPSSRIQQCCRDPRVTAFGRGIALSAAGAASRVRGSVHAQTPGRPGDAQIPEDLHITDIACSCVRRGARRISRVRVATPHATTGARWARTHQGWSVDPRVEPAPATSTETLLLVPSRSRHLALLTSSFDAAQNATSVLPWVLSPPGEPMMDGNQPSRPVRSPAHLSENLRASPSPAWT